VNTILKVVIAVATIAFIGAGGVALYQSQRVEVQVQAPSPPPTPAPAHKDYGDIDKLPPVTLPDNRTPAQKAASETKH
jgi:hypothetical protein